MSTTISQAQTALIADAIESLPKTGQAVQVTLSHALVRLLSEQLYQSPIKAIEELVVNSYDAEATECRTFVPASSDNVRRFMSYYQKLWIRKKEKGSVSSQVFKPKRGQEAPRRIR